MVTLTEPKHLRILFVQMTDRFVRDGISALNRHCTAAEFIRPDAIRGYHTTWLMRRDNTIVEQFTALSALSKEDGRWRVSGSEYIAQPDMLPNKMVEKLVEGGAELND